MPDSAPPAPRPLWVLHFSDTHIGYGSTSASSLSLMIGEVLTATGPALTVLTGDLTDAGTAAQFASYQAIVQGKAPAYPTYLEIIGNHDMKADDGNSFLAASQTGKAGGGLYGLSFLDLPGGRLRVVRTNTADSTSNPTAILGYVTETQRNALLQLPPSAVPVKQTLVLGHHPIKGLQGLQVLGTDQRMQEIVTHFAGEVYLCGHVHAGNLSWVDKTLVVQAPTAGKDDVVSELGFSLVALDETGPAARLFSLSKGTPAVGWPLVLITSPADGKLGGTNPRAAPIVAADELRVRALGLSPTGAQSADVRFAGEGSWGAMTSTDQRLWTASLTAPQQAGPHTLEVRVTSAEGIASHSITIMVGP
jgi:hypothetical protein